MTRDPFSAAAPAQWTLAPFKPRLYLCITLAAASCALTTALLWPLSRVIDLANIVMLYLMVVVLIARFLGRAASVTAAILSVALFDFFFVPPQLSFAVEDVQYLLTFGVMLAVALIIGELVSQINARAVRAAEVAREQTALYDLAHRLAGAMTRERAVADAKAFALQHLAAKLTVLAPDTTTTPETLRVINVDETAPALSRIELAAAEAVYRGASSIDSTEIGDDGAERLVLAMEGSTRRRGVVLLTAIADAPLRAREPIARTLTALLATALERIHYVEVAQASELEIKSQQLRNGLLAALSHDIRTPLTAIYGLADTLVADPALASTNARDSATAVRDQAFALSRMVSNLLELARIRAGRLTLKREWQPIDEVIGASIRFVQTGLATREIRVNTARAADWVDIDAVAIERVLCNLLENAHKYGVPNTPIEIEAVVERPPETLVLEVRNQGSNLDSVAQQRLFQMFERGDNQTDTDGLGIGLAICKALVEAHGGTISASNTATGVAIRFDIPLGSTPEVKWDANDLNQGVRA